MGTEEEKGFVIRDRRSRADAPPGTAEPEPPPSPSRSDAPMGGTTSRGLESEAHPPVTFASLIMSLGTSALMFMGEALDPNQARPPMNLPQAKEIIDILSMLETKTRGNLTTDEQAVLTDMLYALRMKYVALASPGGSGAS